MIMSQFVNGLHHVTSLSNDAAATDLFFTRVLGLRRVKKTVNFDAPDVYHLYYGNEVGMPGTAMTYFPFPAARRGRRGTGEISGTLFTVPAGCLAEWRQRLAGANVPGLEDKTEFGERRLYFDGPAGDRFALVEDHDDDRVPWIVGGLPRETAIRGLHGVAMMLAETETTEDLLRFIGYVEVGREAGTVRLARLPSNGASFVELTRSDAPPAEQGAGSVHHVAFAVPDRPAQEAIREALAGRGLDVTPAIDRSYFWSVYFRSPGGVLFEIATDGPGFARDEEIAHLGETLRLPAQHEHLRQKLEAGLLPELPT